MSTVSIKKQLDSLRRQIDSLAQQEVQKPTAGGRRPAPDLDDSQPVRLTAYLTKDQVKELRAEVYLRQSDGKRSDMSMLLREIVDEFLGKRTGES